MPPSIVATWSEVVSTDRVHLVTLPPSGSDPSVLWNRFCTTVGIDPAAFEAASQKCIDHKWGCT